MVATSIVPVPYVAVHGFCVSADTRALLESVATDRYMLRASTTIADGGPATAAALYRAKPATVPQAIILEYSADLDAFIAGLEQLALTCHQDVKVIVLGRVNDISVYRRLTDIGVADYLVQPCEAQSVVAAVSRAFRQSPGAKVGHVTAVLGARGGAGASSIALNLAWSMSRDLKRPTILVDLDTAFGTAAHALNKPAQQGIGTAIGLTADRGLDETLLERLIVDCGAGLHLLPSPASLSNPFDHRSDTFDAVVDLLRTTHANIILDLPHGWTPMIHQTIAQAGSFVLVSTCDLASVRNAKAIIDTATEARSGAAPLTVLNAVGIPKRGDPTPQQIASAAFQPAAVVPFDPALFGTAETNGQALAQVTPKHPAVAEIAALARRINGVRHPSTGRPPASIGALLSTLLGRKPKLRATTS